MSLKEYFEKTKGIGVLSTADTEGIVNAAIYSRPHIMEDETIAFIMRDRRSHKNITENPHATYLFKEETGFKGKRLYIIKVGEEKNSPLIPSLERRTYKKEEGGEDTKYLVYFRVKEERPLIGNKDTLIA